MVDGVVDEVEPKYLLLYSKDCKHASLVTLTYRFP